MPRGALAFEAIEDAADAHYPWRAVDEEDMRRESIADHAIAQARWHSEHSGGTGFSFFGLLPSFAT